MKLREGEQVRHRMLPEYGTGAVDDTTTQHDHGSVGVQWSNGAHSWSLVENLSRLEARRGR